MNALKTSRLWLYFIAGFCAVLTAGLPDFASRLNTVDAVPPNWVEWLLLLVKAVFGGAVGAGGYIDQTLSRGKVAQSERTSTSGSVNLLGLMLLASLFLVVVGCQNLAKNGVAYVQSVDDGLAKRYGMEDQLTAGREGLLEATAKKLNRKVLSPDAVSFDPEYNDDFGNALTNGISRRTVHVEAVRISERKMSPPVIPHYAPQVQVMVGAVTTGQLTIVTAPTSGVPQKANSTLTPEAP